MTPKKRVAKHAAPTYHGRHAAPTVTSGTPATVAKAPAKKATPAKASPPAGGGGRPPAKRTGGGAGATAVAASTVASHSAASAAAGGKPSVAGRAVGGAAAGAAAGAAVGSVVPVVGTAVGAGVGAAVGGIGGGVSGARAKKAYKRAMADDPRAKKLVVIEFAVCIVIAALSPLTDRRKEEPPGVFMKRMTAIMALFFILGLISSAGRGGARFAAGLGGLVAVGLVVSERDLFTKLAGVFASDTAGEAPTSGPKRGGRIPDVDDPAGKRGGKIPGRRTGTVS